VVTQPPGGKWIVSCGLDPLAGISMHGPWPSLPGRSRTPFGATGVPSSCVVDLPPLKPSNTPCEPPGRSVLIRFPEPWRGFSPVRPVGSSGGFSVFAPTQNPTAPCRTFGLKSQCIQGLAAGRARHRRQCNGRDPLRRLCSCTRTRGSARPSFFSRCFFLVGGAQCRFGSRPRAARPQGLALTRSDLSTLSCAVQAETSACTA